MKKGLNIFDSYDFTDCREIVGNELYKINGGKQVENSNEGVANAQPGDTIIREDKTEITLNQGDIDWAQAHMGSGNTTTQTSSDSINNIPSSNSTGTQSITSETSTQVFTPQFTPGQIAIYKMYNENQIASSDINNSQKENNKFNFLSKIFKRDGSEKIFTIGITGSVTYPVGSDAVGIGVYINPKNDLLYSISTKMITSNRITRKVIGTIIRLLNVEEYGLYCEGAVGFGGGLSASAGINFGDYIDLNSMQGAYIEAGSSIGEYGVSVGIDCVTNLEYQDIGKTTSIGIGVGSFIEGHLRLGGTKTYSIRERDK